MKRIIIFTGKGGVGKTSIAAAHARRSALENKRTILVSTDMAHNLSDIFEQRIGKEIVNIDKNLDALEIDPDHVMKSDFKDLKPAIERLLNSQGMGNIDSDNIAVFPGMEELFSLLKILELYNGGEYETIIVDCAPTGETLSLLKFPELLSWYMEKFFPLGRIGIRVLAPVSKKLFKLELPDKNAMNDIERMYLKLIELQQLLKDHSVTTVRLVMLAEKMVVEETKRNYMYLNLYGYLVDSVYINRVLPCDVKNEFFGEWFGIQDKYTEEINNIFRNIPISKIPWYLAEVCGMRAIDKIAEDVLWEEDLFSVRCDVDNEKYEANEEGYILSLYIPNVEKDKINLHKSGTDVIIKIGNFKRDIPLPSTLKNYDVTAARFEGSILKLQFEKFTD